MKIKKQLILRKIVNDFILVPTGDTVLESNGLFPVTEVGAFIWERIAEGKTEAEILPAILEAYEVDEATAKNDLDEFIGKLVKLGIVEI